VSHLLPVAAGMSPETLRGHTLKIGERLRAASAVNQVAVVPRSITVTTDSTFIRSHDDRERHLEVRVGNVETGERWAAGVRCCREIGNGHRGPDPPVP